MLQRRKVVEDLEIAKMIEGTVEVTVYSTVPFEFDVWKKTEALQQVVNKLYRLLWSSKIQQPLRETE